MARKPGIPSYRNKDGRAVVSLPDSSGERTTHYLGTYGTTEAENEYTRVVAEWQLRRRSGKRDLTINELLVLFWEHAEQHYRHPDGTPTSEVANFKLSLRPLRELYGHTLADQFGPLALKAVRKVMIDAKLARGVINQRIGRIRTVFKWAVAEEIVGPSVCHALQAVEGLQAGRSEAKDKPDVKPVAGDLVDATLPHVNRHVAGMIQVQRLTGMRPGEVCAMRRSEIDMSGAVWFYRPTRHKLSYRGKDRVIGIGPKAQEILKGFFTMAIDHYLFSPLRAREERHASMREKRVTKVQPSQVSRQKITLKRRPRECFTRLSYANAIYRGCTKGKLTKWHPNQLRHAFATDVRKRFGLEAAQVGLGHSKADVTQIYAEKNADLAAKIAAEVG